MREQDAETEMEGKTSGFEVRMGRRGFLAAMAAAAAAGCAGVGTSIGGGRKPNIVLIYIDDLGYADLGCQGSKDLRTPNIDTLARDGARFTDGYVTAPICSPSRAGLMTGRYQQRFGHETNTGGYKREIAEDIGLPTTERTMADLLRAAGCATCAIGKWHLGARDKYHPMSRGFGEYLGHLAGAHDYFKWEDEGWGPIYKGREPAEGEGYLTEVFSREGVSFVRRRASEPFFLYLAYNAVHTPMQAPQKYLEGFAEIADEKRRALAAMLSAVDDGVGEVLKALKEEGLEKDTLVFCISDNGGARANASSNEPLNGSKTTLFEGGVRVPFLMKWPGRIPAGMVCRHPVTTLDVLPTAVAAAKGELPKDRAIDGVDLIPYLKGEKEGMPHEVLFWRVGNKFAVRKGKWKLVRPRSGITALFDLSTDIGESKDLARERPEVVEKLLAEYSRWEKDKVEGLWEWKVRAAGPPREQGA